MANVSIRVDATYHLTVQVGDDVRRGDALGTAPEASPLRTSPVTGTIERIDFDPAKHEFVISIAPSPQ